MGTFAADLNTWLGGYDFTGDTNMGSTSFEFEALDATPYGSTARKRIAGLEQAQASLRGFWQAGAGAVDPEAFAGLGSTPQVITQSKDGAEGSVAYFWPARRFAYTLGGPVGEVLPFELAAQGSRPTGDRLFTAARGKVAKAKGVVSAAGQIGSGLNLGAASSAQRVYASFHIFSAGTSISVRLESDDNPSFTSADLLAQTGVVSAVGSYWMWQTGPITDTYYRLRAVSCTGSFTVAGAIAVDL